MSADFKNKEYDLHEAQLDLTDNVYFGSDSAVNHLLQYNKEDAKDFNHRKEIAMLDNYVFKSVDGAKNVIFRKPVTHEITDTNTLEFLKAVNFNDDINEFSKKVTNSVFKDKFTFVLVDAPAFDGVVTNADAKDKQPYFIHVERKNVINWKQENNIFTHITIQESIDVSTDPFQEDFQLQQRVFFDDGRVQIWRDGNQIGEDIETNIKQVPVVMIGTWGIPPLYDLAKINLTHLNRLSELNRYIRIGAAPFLAVFGRTDANGVTTLGVDEGLSFNSKDEGDVKWIEMTGQNFLSIQAYLTELKETMVDFTANFATTAQIKTATQVDKESTSDESNLTNTAQAVEEGINKALDLRNLYLGKTTEEVIVINKDFDSNIITPEQWLQYRTDFINGVISWERYIRILQDGEVYQSMDEKELTTEKALINIPSDE